MRHHPSEATLLACAAGTLPEPHRRVVAAHVAHCPHCAAILREAEAIGGALLHGLEGSPLEAGALERVMARLDEPARPEPAPAPVTLAALQASGRWRRVAPGIAMMKLIERDETGTRLDLIRVAPGLALLEHGHEGQEMTCVLQGSFDDGHEIYGEGDFAEGGGEVDHQPRTLPGPDCICLISTTGRLKPHSWLGRLMRPLIGM
ncbi:cupin domain-containing protein [Acetobacteraceae bacterium H6797]|nr:cupin domain-containing protein [Acetobacteraceae bacterium H6797]